MPDLNDISCGVEQVGRRSMLGLHVTEERIVRPLATPQQGTTEVAEGGPARPW